MRKIIYTLLVFAVTILTGLNVVAQTIEEPMPTLYSRAPSNYTVNTNAGATLISDPVAAMQLLQPDAIATGQYLGVTQYFFFVLKPVNPVAGWNMSPLTSLYIDARNNANPAIIDSRGLTQFNSTYWGSSYADQNMFSFGAQLINPLGSTATQPIVLTIGEFSHSRTPRYAAITLYPESLAWNGNESQLDNITPSSPNIDLTTFLNVTGETFSGPGVSGTTFSPSSLTSGTYTIKATKVYDNGTFQISKTFTIH